MATGVGDWRPNQERIVKRYTDALDDLRKADQALEKWLEVYGNVLPSSEFKLAKSIGRGLKKQIATMEEDGA